MYVYVAFLTGPCNLQEYWNQIYFWPVLVGYILFFYHEYSSVFWPYGSHRPWVLSLHLEVACCEAHCLSYLRNWPVWTPKSYEVLTVPSYVIVTPYHQWEHPNISTRASILPSKGNFQGRKDKMWSFFLTVRWWKRSTRFCWTGDFPFSWYLFVTQTWLWVDFGFKSNPLRSVYSLSLGVEFLLKTDSGYPGMLSFFHFNHRDIPPCKIPNLRSARTSYSRNNAVLEGFWRFPHICMMKEWKQPRY